MTNLPPLKAFGVEVAEMENKRSEMNENRRALRQAEVALTQLQNQREQAKVEDIRDAVTAKRAGKKDPGDKHQKKLAAEIEKAQREVDVLKGLQTDLEQEASELMRDHTSEISEALGANLKDLNTRQLEAITQLEAVRAQRQGTLRTLETVSSFAPPEQPEAQGNGVDTFEVVVHNRANFHRLDDQQLQKVIAQLKAEAGRRGDLQALVQQEHGTQDIYFPGTASLHKPPGRVAFEERKAAREAARAAEGSGGWMGRTCTICGHDESHQINVAPVHREPYRHIASQCNVSTGALQRHSKEHISELLVKASEAEELARADALMERISSMVHRVEAFIDCAEASDDGPEFRAHLAEWCRQIELLAKIAGGLQQEGTATVNIGSHPS